MNKITIEEFVKRVNSLQAGEHISIQLIEDGYIVTAFATLVKGNRYHFMMVEGFYGNCEQGFEGFDEQGVHEYIDYVKNLAVDTNEMDEITELIVVEEKKNDKVKDGILLFHECTSRREQVEKLLEQDDFFYITSLHRDDLEAVGFDVSEVTDNDMRRLAKLMGDDYTTQLFHVSMEILAEYMGIPKKGELNDSEE